jgi:23S rRNA maturation mini-RNase III
MRQTFRSNIRKPSEPDKSALTDLIIIEKNNRIRIRINKEVVEIPDGFSNDFETIKESTIIIDGVSPEKFNQIRERTEKWINSESKATMFKDIIDLDGEYENKTRIDNRAGYKRNSASQFDHFGPIEFDKLIFSIGKGGMSFEFQHENEQRGINIPSAETVDGFPKDYKNADLLNKTLYDFAKLHLQDQISSEITEPSSQAGNAIQKVERIFNRFGKVARQLEDRDRNRSPVVIDDEYDVQYILHSLLRIYFDDVRAESHTEQHSAVNPRADFILDRQNIAVEVKKASETMGKKKIMSDLSKDKETYRTSSKVNTLLGFIYDPDHLINNLPELESDLEGSNENLETRITITN